MPADVVLILSGDADVGALLADLLELAGYKPAFAAADERPEDTVARIRPRTVVVDCDLPAARANSLYRAATIYGASVILFSPGRPWDEVARRAAPRGLPFFALPIRPAALAQLAERPGPAGT
jgi:hypothetical protein